MTKIFAQPSLPCFAMFAAALFTAACAGNGEGLDVNGQPIVPGGGGSVPLSADFESLQENIFTPICSVCHAGASAPEGLRLDADNSYNLLVGVPSTEVPSLLRVKPGDPADSYIIQKLEGHAAVGGQMPLGGPYLPASTIAFVAQWITNGAPPAAAAGVDSTPFVITSTVPDSVDPVTEPPPQIAVAFNHEIDVSQIDMRSARIERMVPGVAVPTVESIPAQVSVSNINRRVLMIWPSHPLRDGRYRALIRTAAPGFLSDTAGRTVAFGEPNSLGETVVAAFEVEVPP
ncbi:MAG TPA: hypothetical protein VGI65_19975 [Steroidobacteraceae bacterium]|jgi:hypothetical protein